MGWDGIKIMGETSVKSLHCGSARFWIDAISGFTWESCTHLIKLPWLGYGYAHLSILSLTLRMHHGRACLANERNGKPK